jgi:hypothetical protein
LLIFCDHALNLEQEIIFRRAANRMVQKNDLRARPLKLLDKKDLMRIAPGKPVRGVDIDSRDDPSGHRVPQPFKRRTKQNRSAVPFIHKGVVWHEAETIGCDALPERRDLTGNRIVARRADCQFIRKSSSKAMMRPPRQTRSKWPRLARSRVKQPNLIQRSTRPCCP